MTHPLESLGAQLANRLTFADGTFREELLGQRGKVFHPIANAAFVALILSAVVRRWTGVGATWKGRVVR